jgi:hypothetical protein
VKYLREKELGFHALLFVAPPVAARECVFPCA